MALPSWRRVRRGGSSDHPEALGIQSEGTGLCVPFPQGDTYVDTGCRLRHDRVVNSSTSFGDGYANFALADESESVIVKVQAQLEYYFSDANLRRDRFLLTRTGEDGSGFVSVDDFPTFNRLKHIVLNTGISIADAVRAAAANSTLLHLSDDFNYVCRRVPLQPAPSQRQELEGSSAGAAEPMVIGHIPNIYWCAISLEELRLDTRVVALPPPEQLELIGPGAWHWVRQDDPLWDELHWGVLSTRHLRGILGFQEPCAAEFLGLPVAMISHEGALSVFRELCDSEQAAGVHPWRRPTAQADATNKQRRALYNVQQRSRRDVLLAQAEAELVEQEIFASKRRVGNLSTLRCAWGSAQEAAALLGFLEASPSGSQLEEIGLAMLDPRRVAAAWLVGDSAVAKHVERPRRWGKESCSGDSFGEALDFDPDSAQSLLPPLMGASPDAMLRSSSGDLAAVEVKNVCPFFAHGNAYAVHADYVPIKRRSRLPHWRLRAPPERIPLYCVPQIQWEMFATDTHSSYFVYASAFQGTNVFLVVRDDHYVQLMLRAISEFYREFVLLGCPPTANFFWDRPQYHELLEQTRRISEGTRIHQRVRPSRRKRGAGLFFERPATL